MSCGSTCCNITYGFACPTLSAWVGITQGNGLPALSHNWNCVTINGNPPVVGDTFLDSSSNSGNAPGNGHIYKVLTVSLPSGSQYPRNFNSQSCPALPPPPPSTGPCINPITNMPYIIGDDGPGGGIIFSIPQQGNNNTNHYFEVARHDISTTQRDQACTFSVCGGDCISVTNAVPGAEFGVYKETIPLGDNGIQIGDGITNTANLNSYPTSFGVYTPNPTNPVLDIHDLAAKLCADYIGPSGLNDWFLPSWGEASELMLNLGPSSQMGNVANLNTSSINPASEFYWTSSVLKSGYDGLAIGFNATASVGLNFNYGARIMDRCTTGSVRPVRIFKCHTPPPPPSNGIDYDYRLGNHLNPGGVKFDSTDTPWASTPSNWQETAIGGASLWAKINRFDAVGNMGFVGYFDLGLKINLNYWISGAKTIRIKVYSIEEVLLGDYSYSFYSSGVGGCPAGGVSGEECFGQLYLELVQEHYSITPGQIINLTPHVSTIGTAPNTLVTYHDYDFAGGIIDSGPMGYAAIESLITGTTVDLSLPILSSPLVATPNIVTSRGNTANLASHWTGNKRVTLSTPFPLGGFVWPHVCSDCGGAPFLATHRYMVETIVPLCQCTPFYGTPYNDAVAANNACSWLLSGSTSKLMDPTNQICITKNIAVKGIYNNNENQTVKAAYEDNVYFREEENDIQKTLIFNQSVSPNSTTNIFNITFKTNDGYYYSKSPSLNMNFPGNENYRIKIESESKNANGYITEKTFNISYTNTGFDVLEEDGHNIIFTNKIAKEVDRSTEIKEITALRVDTSSVDSNGESRNMSIVGTPGSTFSLTIKDKNGRNILPYSSKITKTIKTVVSASATLELNNAAGLEIGMVVLNDQRRGIKITGISDSVKTNVDAINETSTIFVTISSHLTFAVDDSVTFAKETDITEVAIPDSGVYTFVQGFPALEKFKRTLKTVASSTVSLTLDYNDDLKKDMKITGTGVDGYDPKIKGTDLDVDTDGVTIIVNELQTIADETELTFEMPDNRYDITLYPLMAILGDDVPRYSSKDNDTLPTYSIYQYIDPIVQITPSSALSNVTTTGTITLTGKANKGAVGTSGDITISMTATKSDGSLEASREPQFSSTDSEASDFSNTLNTISKTVREGERTDRNIVHLNNTTSVRVGMIVTGGNVGELVSRSKEIHQKMYPDLYDQSEPYSENGVGSNLRVTVKSIVGTTVELSSKQTTKKGDVLTFSSMFNMRISGLTTTFSENGGFPTGVCTVTGTGKITTFGIDSFTSTLSLDNFLSAV